MRGGVLAPGSGAVSELATILPEQGKANLHQTSMSTLACWRQLKAESHLSGLLTTQSSDNGRCARRRIDSEAIVGNGCLHYHDKVYFRLES